MLRPFDPFSQFPQLTVFMILGNKFIPNIPEFVIPFQCVRGWVRGNWP